MLQLKATVFTILYTAELIQNILTSLPVLHSSLFPPLPLLSLPPEIHLTQHKFTVLSLVPETKYLTRVRAVNANGVGTSSAPITVITSGYLSFFLLFFFWSYFTFKTNILIFQLVYNGTATSANYTSPDGAFHVGWKIDGNSMFFFLLFIFSFFFLFTSVILYYFIYVDLQQSPL